MDHEEAGKRCSVCTADALFEDDDVAADHAAKTKLLAQLLCCSPFPKADWQKVTLIRGNIAAHKRMAVGLYIGLLVAGAFTLLPGRLIGNLVFG